MSDPDDEELAMLRRKRMAELLARQQEAKRREEQQKAMENLMQQKIQAVISYILAPDAMAYLEQVKQRNPSLHDRILGEFFPPEILMNIDQLVYAIRNGRIPRGFVRQVDIQQLEREFLGIKSTITYKKRGEKERVDLSSLLKGGS